MTRRTYGQECPLACALDVLGDRWTLLVTRELMFGQKRYTDLLDGLPGIGPQVLAARRQREGEGIEDQVRRRQPVPARLRGREAMVRGPTVRGSEDADQRGSDRNQGKKTGI